MSLHKGLLGQSESGASVDMKTYNPDKTLGDYITRKTQHDAFTQVAAENKLTFAQWYPANKDKIGFDYDTAQLVWNAAMENK